MNEELDIANESQKRAIGIALALVDETICRFERWGQGNRTRSVLYEETNRLTDHQRESLLAEVLRVRSILKKVKDVLRLPMRARSAEDDVWSGTAALREVLMELEGKGLRAYGDVHSDLARLLHDEVPRLLEGLDRLAHSVARPHGSPDSR